MKTSYRALGLVFLVLLLSACTLLGGYNARAHEHLTALKAANLKFIDTFTTGEGKTYSSAKLEEESDKIDLKFREALEFSASLDDKLRTGNIDSLREVFQEDAANIKKKSVLLTKERAKTLSDTTGRAYDRAIVGECARPDGACKAK